MRNSPLTIILSMVLLISVVMNTYLFLPEEKQKEIKYRFTKTPKQYRIWKDYSQPIPYGIEEWDKFEEDYPEVAFHIMQKQTMEVIMQSQYLDINDFQFYENDPR